MCKRTSFIKFCTCEVIADTNAVSWKLNRYIGTKGNHIMGTVMRTKSDLGNGITVVSVLNTLNSEKNAFDFEYSPSEKDCLTVVVDKNDYTSGYFKLNFKNGKWLAGDSHPFGSILKLLGKGKIQVEEHLADVQEIDDDTIESRNKFSRLFNWLRSKPYNH